MIHCHREVIHCHRGSDPLSPGKCSGTSETVFNLDAADRADLARIFPAATYFHLGHTVNKGVAVLAPYCRAHLLTGIRLSAAIPRAAGARLPCHYHNGRSEQRQADPLAHSEQNDNLFFKVTGIGIPGSRTQNRNSLFGQPAAQFRS